jgi:hypothetical protein
VQGAADDPHVGSGMALGLTEAGADIASLDRLGCAGMCESVRALKKMVFYTSTNP